MSEVRLEEREGIGVVWIGEGENRVNTDLVDGLNAALDDALARGCKGVVTISAGKFYCYGYDLDHIKTLGEGGDAFLQQSRVLLARLMTMPVPTVAAVNGHAFGMGAMIALAHDQRLMRADRGWLCFPEVALGLRLHQAMNQLVLSRLGDRTALEALATGRRYDGPQALESGWVEALAAEDELLDRAVAAADARSGQPAESVAAIKSDLYRPIISLLGR